MSVCFVWVHFFFGLPLFGFAAVASSSAFAVGRRVLVDDLTAGAAGAFVVFFSSCGLVSCNSFSVLLFSALSSCGLSGDLRLRTAIWRSSASRTARFTYFASGDTFFLRSPRRPERRVLSAPLTDCWAFETPRDFGDTLYLGLVPGENMSVGRGFRPPWATVASVSVCCPSACGDLFEPGNEIVIHGLL